MKNVIKIIWLNALIFISVLIVIDFLWYLFFNFDIKNFSNYKINITEKSNMWIVSDKIKVKDLWVKNINWYPYWEMEYRWPSLNYGKIKNQECRVVWIWGSIIRWSWVWEEDTYFHKLSNNFKNSEFINISIPGSMPIQQIIRLNKEDILNDTSLLVWSIWHDDFIHFTYSNGLLYNSKIMLNNYWEISLFNFLPKNINDFFINNSFIYNKLLKITLSYKVNSISSDVTEKFILDNIKTKVEEFTNLNKTNRVIFLMSPYLWIEWQFYENRQHNYMYEKFTHSLANNEQVDIIDLNLLLNVDNLSPYNLDNVHFNKIWNEVVAEKLYEYIQINKLLDEKCY